MIKAIGFVRWNDGVHHQAEWLCQEHFDHLKSLYADIQNMGTNGAAAPICTQ
jgi:hypothetical protein